MNQHLHKNEQIEAIVRDTMESVLKEKLPQFLQKSYVKDWLTTEEVMNILKCSRRHIQYLRDSQQLPFTKNRRSIRYDSDDIERYLAANKADFGKHKTGNHT